MKENIILRKEKKKNESTQYAYLGVAGIALCENSCGSVMVSMWLQSWSPSRL